MPYRTIPGSASRYALLAFDAEGSERSDDPDARGSVFSERILADMTAATPTDVFILSHGWKGDVPAAIEQYDRWIAAMDRSGGRAEAERQRSGFTPFRIGVHWPSQPWGDEELGAGGASFAPVDPVEAYVERLGDRPGLRQAIRTVFAAAAREPAAERLPAEAEDAYRQIDNLLAEVGSAGAAPDDDREPFDPQAYFEAAHEDAETSFGSGNDLGGILAPLRQLSFWKMKQRGKVVGEGGMHSFLHALQASVGEETRIHLMGHSFGCIVTSAMLCGPGTGGTRAKSIASLSLVQGALSHWSFCGDIPVSPGTPGYFNRLVADRMVAGPTVTTRSIYDTAVGRFYPLGAGVANQIAFGPEGMPRYGAVGAFGAQALDPEAVELEMRQADQPYDFEAGRVYNLDASRFIRNGDGASGAHNDIDGPEVAHMVWSAALARKP
ncbi:hypothetical protein [Methylobacterium oxalidis]|uniref:hypothetical protein n=1 Tax=Methylobacterium oxalidis TaxID=944322 RepID=UPI00331559E3